MAVEPAHTLGRRRPDLLRMNAVSKVFGRDVTALKSMSLSVREGDFVSLLGPSGCGKSTALRLIAGLAPPTTGRIEWEGAGGEGELGVVFQEPTLMPWATVAGNVWLPFRLRGRPYRAVADEVRTALSLVGLDAFRDSYPRELSGGMKMRAAIARALVTRPKLLLMDEPFAALDEITRFRLNHDLLEMRETLGCTVVFVTHSVFESVFLSERIAVMAARPGRVVSELSVDAPYPRDESFRTSNEYAGHCRSVSEALKTAMEAA